jgi:hypothetical protein
MDTELSPWERETLELLRESQLEASRLEQKLIQLQRQAADATKRLDSIQQTLDAYRAKHGRSALSASALDKQLATIYEGLNPKQMVLHWAEDHDGLVVMTEMTGTLATAGLFTDKRHADGVLYPVVRRTPGFEKVGRGIYRKAAETRTMDGEELQVGPLSRLPHHGRASSWNGSIAREVVLEELPPLLPKSAETPIHIRLGRGDDAWSATN